MGGVLGFIGSGAFDHRLPFLILRDYQANWSLRVEVDPCLLLKSASGGEGKGVCFRIHSIDFFVNPLATYSACCRTQGLWFSHIWLVATSLAVIMLRCSFLSCRASS